MPWKPNGLTPDLLQSFSMKCCRTLNGFPKYASGGTYLGQRSSGNFSTALKKGKVVTTTIDIYFPWHTIVFLSIYSKDCKKFWWIGCALFYHPFILQFPMKNFTYFLFINLCDAFPSINMDWIGFFQIQDTLIGLLKPGSPFTILCNS